MSCNEIDVKYIFDNLFDYVVIRYRDTLPKYNINEDIDITNNTDNDVTLDDITTRKISFSNVAYKTGDISIYNHVLFIL